MNRVFSAKRKEVKVTYEFLDGTSTDLSVVSLSTNENIKLSEMAQREDVLLHQFLREKSAKHLQKNDEGTAKRVILEQMTEGNIIEFAQAISKVIGEEKEGKPDA